MSTLVLLLGDQLSTSMSSLEGFDKTSDIVLLAEVREEATYVKHHKKKIAFLFSAMRHFSHQLVREGFQVIYKTYDCPNNLGSLLKEVEAAIKQKQLTKLILTHPGEYRVLQDMQSWQKKLGIPVEIRQDQRFLASLEEFAEWAKDRKQLRMEFFYREMRKKWHILMDDQKPVGDKWNFDSANRNALPVGVEPPAPTKFKPDTITQDVIDLVEREFADHFGSLDNFHYATTQEQAEQVLHAFIDERLVNFGEYQDAMARGQPWMFHSHIGLYLNCGLLTPKQVIEAAELAYRQHKLPLNSVEGFIRQILGWREYVRGLYWLKMPAFKSQNYLDASRPLPAFFWDSQTKMNCIKQCVQETYDNAYAHHIQRLMVLGNFALLAGLSVEDVNEWYLLVYADAYEWVELPNVSGMVLFADGGVLASKPYAASGNYINKMSNYCKSCTYKVSVKTGPKACPFNYLYWDFLSRHQDKLGNNPRLGMPYRTLAKMTDEKRQVIAHDSQRFLTAMDKSEEV